MHELLSVVMSRFVKLHAVRLQIVLVAEHITSLDLRAHASQWCHNNGHRTLFSQLLLERALIAPLLLNVSFMRRGECASLRPGIICQNQSHRASMRQFCCPLSIKLAASHAPDQNAPCHTGDSIVVIFFCLHSFASTANECYSRLVCHAHLGLLCQLMFVFLSLHSQLLLAAMRGM